MEFKLNSNNFIVDRIESKLVVLENYNGNMLNVPLKLFRGHIDEGDIITLKGETYFKDPELTKKRKSDINNLMKGMWKDE
ncbi:Protein of uncharacterised function (DUF3006) [Clostridium putrefaciens]|uniref:Protein of uncharacterized function (DUF3006) n=1 Tax=Clostridium putrefaciens TaxID=99675 RepID=A0A381J5T2_9CLOT|nr:MULTISPECIES: DUF3006 domain-containing protein [Clostridium]MBU3209555.1 DUF3006 domain-containing protein [Clostridium algidicarnis]SUY46232.1 Protein of uncharacterised function (DUF3006) [Clostridium putrefaciens]